MFLFKEIIYIFIGLQIILDMNIGGKMSGSIGATINIITDQEKEIMIKKLKLKLKLERVVIKEYIYISLYFLYF